MLSIRTFFRISSEMRWLKTNYLSLCLSQNVFISPLCFKNSFAGYRSLDGLFFFLRHFKCYSTAFWPPLFLLRNKMLILLGFPCQRSVMFLLLILQIFSLSFPFSIFAMMSLFVDLFAHYFYLKFIELPGCVGLVFVNKFERFSSLVLSIFSCSFLSLFPLFLVFSLHEC